MRRYFYLSLSILAALAGLEILFSLAGRLERGIRPAQAAAAPAPAAIAGHPTIQQMIDQVVSETVYTYLGDISGEQPVWVGGEWYTISSRYTYSGVPIQKATQWAGEHFASLGLDVEYHQWGGSTYPNVIAEMPGLINPEDIYIIGGHLDDVQNVPGADDNGSGSVATLIAADILSQYQWGCTLRFALWTGEEQNLYGSAAYAQRAYNRGENILGYLNLDMIAYNTPGSSPGFDLKYNPYMPATHNLAQLFYDVVSAYNLNLIPDLTIGGFASDQSSFWDRGYAAILASEDQTDLNPYYHRSGDNIDHINLGFFTEFVKAAVATTAHMSGCLITRDGYLFPSYQQQNDVPATTLTVLIDLYNFTDIADSYNLTLGPHAWETTLSADRIGPLPRFGSQVFSVTVVIPPDADWYQFDTVIITATSVNRPNEHAAAQVTTRVYAPSQIDIDPLNLESTQAAGQTITLPMTIRNGNGVPLTYEITTGFPISAEVMIFDPAMIAEETQFFSQTSAMTPDVPWLMVNPVSGTVPANASQEVTVTFDAADLPPGIYTTTLYVINNDPLDPLVAVPVMMMAVGPVTPIAVTISGLDVGWLGVSQTFRARVEPIYSSLPVTYTWQATGQEPVIHTGWNTDTVTFTWQFTGTQQIAVTAVNDLGAVIDTHAILITIPQSFYLPILLNQGQAGSPPPGTKASADGFVAALLNGGAGVGWWLLRLRRFRRRGFLVGTELQLPNLPAPTRPVDG